MDIETVVAETAIRNLGYQFADAVNRNDVGALMDLWAGDAAWIIDPPMNVSAKGSDAIGDLFGTLMSGWTFFHQVPHQGPITVQGDHATARMYMHEIGIFKDGRTHRNWSEYVDRYLRIDGRWLYAERHYHFLYVDGPPMHPDLLGIAVAV
jgi:ketosteroid isomerase-like protein